MHVSRINYLVFSISKNMETVGLTINKTVYILANLFLLTAKKKIKLNLKKKSIELYTQ